jgi:transglutaminase-like putative cysteine protease
MNELLRSTDVIDWEHPAVAARARALRAGLTDPVAIARRAFEWVRDEIKHSADFGLERVTVSASEVLEIGSGYCYAKNHLFAALLRANGLPAGLSYQRLSLDDEGRRFCLHGFNAVLLPGIGWYRADPRGNRAGIDAVHVGAQAWRYPAGSPGPDDVVELISRRSWSIHITFFAFVAASVGMRH